MRKIIFLNGSLNLVKDFLSIPRAHAVAYVMIAFRIAWFRYIIQWHSMQPTSPFGRRPFDLRVMAGDLKTQMTEFNRN